MAKQTINLGSGDSRGDGESIRTAFDKCNDNFSELYTSVDNAFDGAYSSLTGKPTIPTVPTTVSSFTNDAGYLTSYTETDPVFTAWDKSTGISITESQISDLQNYLTSYTVTEADVTAHQAALTITESQISDLTHFSGAYADLTGKPTIPSTGNFTLSNNTISTNSGDTGIDLAINGATSDDPPSLVNKAWRFVNDGSLQFRSPMNFGSEVDATITSTKVGQWDTAYGWGNHASAGYISGISVTTDSTNSEYNLVFVPGSGNKSSVRVDGGSNITYNPSTNTLTLNSETVTSTKIGQWDDAYGWGDHSTAGYLTSSSAASAISVISTTGTAQEFPLLFVSGSGNHTPRVDATKLTFNPSTDTLSVNSATVTSTKISNWDTAHGWGNHASAGYVESDTTGITGADQVSNIVTLTQAEYDAIGTPNASTVYIIVG